MFLGRHAVALFSMRPPQYPPSLRSLRETSGFGITSLVRRSGDPRRMWGRLTERADGRRPIGVLDRHAEHERRDDDAGRPSGFARAAVLAWRQRDGHVP